MSIEEFKQGLGIYLCSDYTSTRKVQVLWILKIYLLTQVMLGQVSPSRHCDMEAVVDYCIYQLTNN